MLIHYIEVLGVISKEVENLEAMYEKERVRYMKVFSAEELNGALTYCITYKYTINKLNAVGAQILICLVGKENNDVFIEHNKVIHIIDEVINKLEAKFEKEDVLIQRIKYRYAISMLYGIEFKILARVLDKCEV